ncbi:hypothetical protein MMC24_002831 [Lignoscripta atroalba]|nr:hypothetical protein [Lignoscripta atroalba]
MKRNGNTASNRTYNPRNTKPPIPLDVDEVDAAMERFIRQKYDHRLSSGDRPARPQARNNTGSTGSSDDQPPPLPPKTGRRFFGLRAASSAYPLSRNTHGSPPTSPNGRNEYAPAPSSIGVNKQPRVLDATFSGVGESMESKLAILRDMGFPDDKRNSNILKGLGGNLERAIESLVRLGEGNRALTLSKTSLQHKAAESSLPSPNSMEGPLQAHTEKPPENRAQAGLQLQTPLPQPQPQQEPQVNIGFDTKNPFQQQSYNPFDTSNPYSAPLQFPEAMFQNMHVTQTLFPNATGGYPSQQQQMQQERLQQSMTPPVPQLPQQYLHSNPYAQQPPNHGYNPFFQTTQQAPPTSANPFFSMTQQTSASNSYLNQGDPNGVTFQTTQIQNSPQQPFAQFQPLRGTQQQNFFNQPYFGPDATQDAPSTDRPLYQPQMQTLGPQRTGRFDKTSILALYNYPQLAPQPSSHDINAPSTIESSVPSQPSPSIPPSCVPMTQTQRSVTMPPSLSSGSRNPFLPSNTSSTTSALSQPNGGPSRHVSQESVDVGGLQNGRHSPDAFASLSARFVR